MITFTYKVEIICMILHKQIRNQIKALSSLYGHYTIMNRNGGLYRISAFSNKYLGLYIYGTAIYKQSL